MCSESGYRLADGVQVRREKFGLLFYDYRGPRLYFVPSKDLVQDDFFSGRSTVRELVETICAKHDWPHRLVSAKVSEILALLKAKGLVYEQSVC